MNKWVILVVLAVVGFIFREPLLVQWDNARAILPKLRTEMEMNEIRTALEAEMGRGVGEPPADFTAWLEDRFDPKGEKPPSVDRYGEPYRLERGDQRGTWAVRSCGRDTVCHTEDDLLVTVVPGA